MTGIHRGLVTDRIYDLQIGGDEIAQVLGPPDGSDQEGLDPEHISVAQLGRLAALLGLHPADLIDDGPSGREEGHADGLLAEFALADEDGGPAGCAQMLGWSPSRLDTAKAYLYSPSPRAAMGVADGLAQEGIGSRATGERGAPRYRAYFAARTAPDPFDAAALLRLLAAADPGAKPTGYTTSATAHRLAAHALVLLEGAPGSPPGPYADSGFDTIVTLHPDLLYALDLAPAPPAPPPGSSATTPREAA